jgi:hypothetical protein
MKKYWIALLLLVLPLLSGCFIHHHDRGGDGYHRGHYKDRHDYGYRHRDHDRGHRDYDRGHRHHDRH